MTIFRRLPEVAQILGLSALLIGLFLLCGLAWTLLSGGLVVAIWGIATEARGGA